MNFQAEGRTVVACAIDDDNAHYRAEIISASASGTDVEITAGEKKFVSCISTLRADFPFQTRFARLP